MILSLALPSTISILEKNELVFQANESKIGIFLSDLPQNHDVFQLLSLWSSKYSNIPIFGTAIISPLSHNSIFLKKQIQTLFELKNDIFEIGLGVGDRKFFDNSITKPFSEFKLRIGEFLNEKFILESKNRISLAGSGEKLVKFTKDVNFGLIFNGIPDNSITDLFKDLKKEKNVSSFIMAEFEKFENLSSSFISIVVRILVGLSIKELKRLNITKEAVIGIRKKLNGNDLENYKNWLDPSLIKKVSFYGTEQEFKVFLNEMRKLDLKQIILSFPNKKSRESFLTISKSLIIL